MIPQVPTDNIYKSVAFISALAAVATGVVYQQVARESFDRNKAAAILFKEASVEFDARISKKGSVGERSNADIAMELQNFAAVGFSPPDGDILDDRDVHRMLNDAQLAIDQEIEARKKDGEGEIEKLIQLKLKLGRISPTYLDVWIFGKDRELLGYILLYTLGICLFFFFGGIGGRWWTLQRPSETLLKAQARKEAASAVNEEADTEIKKIQLDREKIRLATDKADEQLKKVQLELETIKLQNEKKAIAAREKTHAAMTTDANGSKVPSLV